MWKLWIFYWFYFFCTLSLSMLGCYELLQHIKFHFLLSELTDKGWHWGMELCCHCHMRRKRRDSSREGQSARPNLPRQELQHKGNEFSSLDGWVRGLFLVYIHSHFFFFFFIWMIWQTCSGLFASAEGIFICREKINNNKNIVSEHVFLKATFG